MIGSLFSRWRPRHLLLSWLAYWIVLVVVKLGPALLAAWQLSRRTAHGNAGVSVTNGIISASISESGHTIWSGSTSFTQLTLLVALPPLLIWAVWLLSSSRTDNAGGMRGITRADRHMLNAESRIGTFDTSSSSPSKRRAREEP